MQACEYEFDEIKNRMQTCGIVSVINNMFGSNIACEQAVMFGEKPVDDKLLAKITDVVYRAASEEKLSLDQAREVMGVVYEYHSEMDETRANKMAEKGRNFAHKAMKSHQLNTAMRKFCDAWGMFDEAESAADKNTLTERRKDALENVFKKEIVPAFIKIEGLNVKPAIKFDYGTDDVNYAVTEASFTEKGCDISVTFYFKDDALLEKDAVDWMAMFVHELHHCSQYQKMSKNFVRHGYWGFDNNGKVDEMMMYPMLRYAHANGHVAAEINNPMEQEAYAAERAFECSLRQFFDLPKEESKSANETFLNNMYGEGFLNNLAVYKAVNEKLKVR